MQSGKLYSSCYIEGAHVRVRYHMQSFDSFATEWTMSTFICRDKAPHGFVLHSVHLTAFGAKDDMYC